MPFVIERVIIEDWKQEIEKRRLYGIAASFEGYRNGIHVTQAADKIEKPHIVIITAREDEFVAVLSRIDRGGAFFKGKKRTYATGTIQRRSGERQEVAVV